RRSSDLARRHAVSQIPPPVSPFGLNQGDIAVNGLFIDMPASVDQTCFLAIGQFRTIACRAKKAADACTSSAQPFGQIALRHQLQLDLATAIQIIKYPGVCLTGKAADNLADPASLE